MNFHNATKRILTAPRGGDHRSADRMSLLCRALGIPRKGLCMVHVLGESGKSACATMLSHALCSQRVRVGCLTTPFSHTVTECITLDCKPISMENFTSCVSRVFEAVGQIAAQLSELAESVGEDEEGLTAYERELAAYRSYSTEFEPFADELLLASALLFFSESDCQLALIEIPLGDRASAYRLPVAPTVSVITHTESSETATHVCRSLDKRTGEIVTAIQSKAVYGMISNACAAINCRLTMPLRREFYPREFAANRFSFFYKKIDLNINSGAYYQALNLLTAAETVEALKRNGFSVEPFACAYQPDFGNAGVDLQFTFLSLDPTIITDFADTEARVKAFAQSLNYHADRLGQEITIITEPNDAPDMSDGAITECFVPYNIPITNVLRTTETTARRTLKPLIKQLTPHHSLLVLGSRPFVYETVRILKDLLA